LSALRGSVHSTVSEL